MSRGGTYTYHMSHTPRILVISIFQPPLKRGSDGRANDVEGKPKYEEVERDVIESLPLAFETWNIHCTYPVFIPGTLSHVA